MNTSLRRALIGGALATVAAIAIQAKCTKGSYQQSCVGGHIWCCEDKSQCATVSSNGTIQTVYSKAPDASKAGEMISPSPLLSAQLGCGAGGEGIM